MSPHSQVASTVIVHAVARPVGPHAVEEGLCRSHELVHLRRGQSVVENARFRPPECAPVSRSKDLSVPDAAFRSSCTEYSKPECSGVVTDAPCPRRVCSSLYREGDCFNSFFLSK